MNAAEVSAGVGVGGPSTGLEQEFRRMRGITERMLGVMERQEARVCQTVRIRGTRLRQFEEFGRLMGQNPKPTKAAAYRMAIRNVPGTASDPGFGEPKNLKRYVDSKPGWFTV